MLFLVDCGKEEDEDEILMRLMQSPAKNVKSIATLLRDAIDFERDSREIFHHTL